MAGNTQAGKGRRKCCEKEERERAYVHTMNRSLKAIRRPSATWPASFVCSQGECASLEPADGWRQQGGNRLQLAETGRLLGSTDAGPDGWPGGFMNGADGTRCGATRRRDVAREPTGRWMDGWAMLEMHVSAKGRPADLESGQYGIKLELPNGSFSARWLSACLRRRSSMGDRWREHTRIHIDSVGGGGSTHANKIDSRALARSSSSSPFSWPERPAWGCFWPARP